MAPPEVRGRAALPRMPAARAEALLAPPWVPAGLATDEARAAAGLGVPILIEAPAVVRLRLARALHAVSGRPGPLLAIADRRPVFDDLPPDASIVVDAGRLAREAATVLAALCDDGVVWVIAGLDPGAAVPGPLRGVADAMPVVVPALDVRRGDVAAIAAAVLERRRRAGRPVPALAEATRAALAARAWPGDVVELETVVTRALLRAGEAATIGPEHLEAPDEAVPAGAPADAPAATTAQLEFLLAELAHELRNPLVTVKTFAEHLPQLLEDAALREQFATLAGEAIGRMDGLLENVLAFARLARPRREPVAVGPLIDGVLGEIAPTLAGRALEVRRTGAPDVQCAGDPEHLSYALRNLFEGIVREVPPREEIVLDTSANGVVRVHFHAGGADLERLRRLLAPERGGDLGAGTALTDPTLLPLAFTLARAVLTRGGARLDVVPDPGGDTTLVVRLPVAPGTGTLKGE